MEQTNINPYIEKIFGDWFKKILIIIVAIPLTVLLIVAVFRQWIDQNFAVDVIFLLLGIYVGKWFENGKR